jgi:serine/threonine-protein kinase
MELFDRIAVGGMGVVLRGRDPDLGRELAVKVLKVEYLERPEFVRRFFDEAQINGQLQHPGIVPVHKVGKLDDGRPYFSMKLIKGQRLSDRLGKRWSGDPPEWSADTEGSTLDRSATGREIDQRDELARFLAIFEKVLDAVAYAHARDVINRDLKPSNIMVGSYGEVMVIDWGLAKVLTYDHADDTEEPERRPRPETRIETARPSGETDEDYSRPGTIKGTYSYMAPEQARAEAVDKRSDVFSLGSILCELLTGTPAFTGATESQLRKKAQKPDLEDAIARLNSCGADAALVQLALDCLAPIPQHRPADASAVAARLSAYLLSVERRLREAELARAAEAARAKEALLTAAEAKARVTAERGAHRSRMATVVALVALIGAVGTGVSWYRFDQTQRVMNAEKQVNVAMRDSESSRAKALLSEPGETVYWREALAQAQRALDPAKTSGVSPDLANRVTALVGELRQGLARAEQLAERLAAARALLSSLETVRGSRAEHGDLRRTDSEYAAAFRSAGIDIDRTLPAEVGSWVEDQPERPQEIAAQLDEWAQVRMKVSGAEVGWHHIVACAEAADPDPWRNALRAAAFGPSNLAENRLQGLADDPKSLTEQPAASMVLLARVLASVVGDRTRAERVLRLARDRYPDDFWVNVVLAQILGRDSRDPRVLYPRAVDAIRYLSAAVSLRPQSSTARNNLGVAFLSAGAKEDALVEFRHAVSLREGNLYARANLANVLFELGHAEDAEGVIREAVEQYPDDAVAHNNLGLALAGQKRTAEADAAFSKAIDLEPARAMGYINLGKSKLEQGDRPRALELFEKAVAVERDSAIARFNLGNALRDLGKLDRAIEEFREAARLAPEDPSPRINLGRILMDEGKHEDAEAAFLEAAKVDPNSAQAHADLGRCLLEQVKLERAIASLEASIKLDSKPADTWYNLGRAHYLRWQGGGDAHELEQSFRAFQESTKRNPKHADALHDLGLVYQSFGDTENAITCFRQAVAIKPEHAKAHSNLGIVLQAQGKWDASIVAFQAAVKHDSRLAEAHNNLANALVIAPDRALRNPALASEHIDKAIKLDSGNGNYVCTRALVEYRLDKLAYALATLNESRTMRRGGDAYEDFIEALVKYQRGEASEAKERFDRAVAWARQNAPIDADLRILWSEAASLLKQPEPPEIRQSAGER